jgi:hypothetical protein
MSPEIRRTAEVCDYPFCTTSPERQALILDEFRRRLD